MIQGWSPRRNWPRFLRCWRSDRFTEKRTMSTANTDTSCPHHESRRDSSARRGKWYLAGSVSAVWSASGKNWGLEAKENREGKRALLWSTVSLYLFFHVITALEELDDGSSQFGIKTHSVSSVRALFGPWWNIACSSWPLKINAI